MADEAFYDLLVRAGVGAWRSKKAFWGVRLFGGSAWDEGGKKQ